MDENLVCALRARRPEIRARWEALLRTERVTSPLANPDALVHMLDWTISDVLGALDTHVPRRPPPPQRSYTAWRAGCECGRNPLLAYFLAGEQALIEALILTQAEAPPTSRVAPANAVAELHLIIRQIAQHEVDAFCAMCQHRAHGHAASAGHSPSGRPKICAPAQISSA